MKVIRIEHKDTGIGVFRAYNHSDKRNLYRERFDCMANRIQLMPEPCDEIWNLNPRLMFENKNLVCAFSKIEHLTTYIVARELRELVREWNMRIYEIEVDTPYVGRQQVVYERGTEKYKKDITQTILMAITMFSNEL